ncbi:MAG: hypothetical protein AAF411_06980 [Myxococcota bacterium]
MSTAPALAQDEPLADCPDVRLHHGTLQIAERSFPLAELDARLRRAQALEPIGGACAFALATRVRQMRTLVLAIVNGEPVVIARIPTSLASQANALDARIEGLSVDREGHVSWTHFESRTEACQRTPNVRYAPRHAVYGGERAVPADGSYVDCAQRETPIRRPRPPRPGSLAPAADAPNAPTPPTVRLDTNASLTPGGEPSRVRIWSDGRLEVGNNTAPINLSLVREGNALRVSTECFNGRHNLLWISAVLEDQYEEDYFSRAQAYILKRDRLIRVLAWERHGAGWMTPERLGPLFRCDGTVRERRVSGTIYDARGRRIRDVRAHSVHDLQVSPIVDDVYRLRGDRLVHDSSVRTGLMHDRLSFAACPHVYVMRNGVFEANGAILRHLVGESSHGEQSLQLGRIPAGTLRVQLREEEHEITRLDHVEVVIDGHAFAPEGCEGAHCDADGNMHSMRQGDVLDLRFIVPAGEAHLRASGYYDVFPSTR